MCASYRRFATLALQVSESAYQDYSYPDNKGSMDSVERDELFRNICQYNVFTPPTETVLVARKPPYEQKEVFNTEDVKQAIKDAKAQRKIVRVRGSMHSTDEHFCLPGEGIVLILKGDLQKISSTSHNDEKLICTVGAGCFLGESPEKDEHGGTFENSLVKYVDDRGFAMPILGGISHQTVSGFMMTGSAGGSLSHGFADVVTSITFVDGNGEEQFCEKDKDDLFNAVGVSMGLFGVITSVTLEFTDKKYRVEGTECNVTLEQSFLANGQTLVDSFKAEENEYCRINWFPQKDVNAVMQWRGKRVAADSNRIPYKHPLNCRLVGLGANLALRHCNWLLHSGFLTCDPYKNIGCALRTFVKVGNEAEFCDEWYKALPVDNQARVNTLMVVDFTEVWLPFKKSNEVLKKLKSLYDDSKEGQEAAGSFCVEIYCAKASPFWLSMSHDQNMLRVDPFWFHDNAFGDKRDYFTYVWNTLLGIEHARLHWGKFLPEPNQVCGDVTFNLEYLKKAYPKMDAWLDMREKMDPDQVFVNKYWREILEIPSPHPA